MFVSTLKRWFGHTEIPLPFDPESNDGQARIRDMLAADHLLDVVPEVVDFFLASGKFRRLRAGEKFVTQGGLEDDVYFLLSGNVSVRQRGREIDAVKAPFAVGEIVAQNPGTSRTADLIAVSENTIAWVVKGSDFLAAKKQFPTFAKRLEQRSHDLSIRKIAQISKRPARSSTAEIALKALAAIFAAIATVIFATFVGATIQAAIVLGAGIGAVVLIVMAIWTYQLSLWLSLSSTIAAMIWLFSSGSLNFSLTLGSEHGDERQFGGTYNLLSEPDVMAAGAIAFCILVQAILLWAAQRRVRS